MSVQVLPNLATRTITIAVDVKRTEDASASRCSAIRTRFINAFIGQSGTADRRVAIAEALDKAFLHRGIVSQVSPSYVGLRLAETTTVTVTIGKVTCGGPITE